MEFEKARVMRTRVGGVGRSPTARVPSPPSTAERSHALATSTLIASAACSVSGQAEADWEAESPLSVLMTWGSSRAPPKEIRNTPRFAYILHHRFTEIQFPVNAR